MSLVTNWGQAILKYIGIAETMQALPPVVGDVTTGMGALATVMTEAYQRKVTLASVEEAVNDVQKILVDLGVEPPQVEQAIGLLEVFLPALQQLYATGLVAGGVPAAFPPGGGPGEYRSR